MASTLAHDHQEETPDSVLDLPARHGPGDVNRRFTPRVAARFVVNAQGKEQSYSGIDISFGGMMCTGGEPLWPGNTMDAELLLPGESAPLTTRARVVELVSYRGHVAMRMRFEGMTHHQRKTIALWMARRARINRPR